MKIKYKILLLIIGIFIFIPIVYAEDDFVEYGLIYNPTPNSQEEPTIHGMHVVDTNMDDICDDVNKDDLFDFDESTMTLTLKEGVHYVGIYSPVSITITSNNEQVYLNIINSEQILNLVNLTSSSYTTKGTTPLLTQDGTTNGSRYYTHVHAQEINIVESHIVFNYEGDELQNDIHTQTEEEGLISNEGQVGNGNITITDSYVETVSGIYVLDGKDIIISDSTVKAYALLANGSSNQADLTIDNAQVVLLSDLLVDTPHADGPFISFYGKLTITDGDIITNGSIVVNQIIMTDAGIYGSASNKKYYLMAMNTSELNMTRSHIDVLGGIIAVTVDMNNSTLSAETGSSDELVSKIGFDFRNTSALLTRYMTLTDSEFRVVSHGNVPALIITDTFESNKDNHVIINDSYELENLEKVTLADYGFTPSGSSNALALTELSITRGYTALLNGEAAYEVTTAHTKEVTLKIQNGTWEDGTTDNKVVTIIEGLTPDKEIFKSTSSIENGVLTIKETGENEYTFVYSDPTKEQNPKTGVRSFIALLLISFIGVIVLNNYRDKISFFKKI